MKRLLSVLAAAGAVLVAVAITLVAAGPVAAQEPPPEPPPDEAAQTVQGTLRYDDEAGDEVLVEGIDLTIESADGSFSEDVTTDEDGAFSVEVPGPGSYVASIDPDSLPEDVALKDEDRTELTFTLGAGQSRNVLFPLQFGDAATSGGGYFDRALRLGVEGIRFGLIIAICAVGLSLIFGTTGLVNFAHGEMVTWGALVAFFFNVTVGLPMLVAAPLAILIGGA